MDDEISSNEPHGDGGECDGDDGSRENGVGVDDDLVNRASTYDVEIEVEEWGDTIEELHAPSERLDTGTGRSTPSE